MFNFKFFKFLFIASIGLSFGFTACSGLVNEKSSYEEVLAQTIARDKNDFARESSQPAKDAIIIDTSELSIEQVFEKVCKIVETK